MYNTCIFNCRAYINYTIRYIYYIDFLYFLSISKDDFLDLDSMYKEYFLTNLIDYAIVNKFSIKDFFHLNVNCL